MLITENFIMINFPKTGSSFCRKVIKEAHVRRCQRIGRLGRLMRGFTCHEEFVVTVADPSWPMASQHGAVSQTPHRYRYREKMSISRNPFDLFRSWYEYSWWKNFPGLKIEDVRSAYPSFPDLTPIEYCLLNKDWLSHYFPHTACGFLTVYFVNMYFSDPESVIRAMSDEFIDSGIWLRDFDKFHFLRNDQLVNDLIQYLIERGFEEEDLEFIKSLLPVNVSPKSDFVWSQHLIEQISNDERFLLRILEKLGLDYSLPSNQLT